VDVRVTQPGPINVKALDISQSGMLLEVPQSAAHWALGKDLQLQFTLPAQSQVIKAGASVVRKQGATHLGVRFTRLLSEDLQALQQYVQSLPPS